MKIFNPIKWYKKRLERKKAQKETTKRVLEEYKQLIHEYRLIQEKKSKLSRSQRDFVVLRINHLISKGHLSGKHE